MAKTTRDCPECGGKIEFSARNRREVERFADWRIKSGAVCENCDRRRRDEENAKAAEANAAAGLPILAGSPAQVAWAETIRRAILADVEKMRPLAEIAFAAHAKGGAEAREYAMDEIRRRLSAMGGRDADVYWAWLPHLMNAVGTIGRYDAFVSVLRQEVRASWWINNRAASLWWLAKLVSDQIDKETVVAAAPPVDPGIVAAVEAEALIRPAGELVTATVAEVAHVGGELHVLFPEKRGDFNRLIKSMAFTWGGERWTRSLNQFAGDPVDRVAEVAHAIVAAGFAVRVLDQEARARAISGAFQPEHTRWIAVQNGGTYSGRLKIVWRKPDDLYAAARSLPGSRYKDGAVYVPIGAIEAVAEFAERYDFRLSAKAEELLVAHRAALAAGAVVTDIRERPAPVSDRNSGSPPRLDAPDDVGIDDELRDV